MQQQTREVRLEKNYLIRIVQILVWTILKNNLCYPKNLQNRILRKRVVTLCIIALQLQVLPWLHISFKEKLKVVPQINPVIEIPLQKLNQVTHHLSHQLGG